MTPQPPRLAVDAQGYVWQVYDEDTWSMAPSNPDNEPIPQPVAFYVPLNEIVAQILARGETRREGPNGPDTFYTVFHRDLARWLRERFGDAEPLFGAWSDPYA